MNPPFQPELVTVAYPTGRFTVQLNARSNYYHENEAHRKHAEDIIAQIAKLTTPAAYAPKKPKRPLSPKRERGALGLVNGGFYALACNLQPKRAPSYIGPSFKARDERDRDASLTRARGARWPYPPLFTETIGGEPWSKAYKRMAEVADIIGWRYGWTKPGDYIPSTVAEARQQLSDMRGQLAS